MVPILETARLRLREFRVSDLEAQAAAEADPLVYRFLGGTPRTREEVWRRMLMSPGMWAMLGYGFWAVERKEDGLWLGQAGFGDFKRDLVPPIAAAHEMGWVFASHAHGQGYASEAVAAAVAWGEANFGAVPYAAIVAPENLASIRVAEKVGFVRKREAVYHDEPILIFERPASPAAAAASSSTTA